MRRTVPRILYGIEFFAALPAILIAWNQIGGASHFDAIEWQWKLLCSGGLAWAVTRLTAAIAESDVLWTRRFVLWSLGVAALAFSMGWLSHQAHLNEKTEQDADEDGDVTIEETERTPNPL